MGVTVERNGGVTVNANRYAPKGLKEISVERLLQWAYATEKVRGSPSWGSSGVGKGWGETAEAAGSGCHPDALVVDRLVEQLSESAGHLVRDHALACTRPDWKPKARHRFEPLWPDPEEKPAPQGSLYPVLGVATFTHPPECRCGGLAHLCEARDIKWKVGQKGWPYCPAIERDNPVEVQAFREAWYIPWVGYLKVIRDAFRAQSHGAVLAAHAVTEALPPLTPWLSKNPLDGELARL